MVVSLLCVQVDLAPPRTCARRTRSVLMTQAGCVYARRITTWYRADVCCASRWARGVGTRGSACARARATRSPRPARASRGILNWTAAVSHVSVCVGG